MNKWCLNALHSHSYPFRFEWTVAKRLDHRFEPTLPELTHAAVTMPGRLNAEIVLQQSLYNCGAKGGLRHASGV